MFVVTIDQTLHTTPGHQPGPARQYAVTVVNNGGTWLVNDIELTTAGNYGVNWRPADRQPGPGRRRGGHRPGRACWSPAWRSSPMAHDRRRPCCSCRPGVRLPQPGGQRAASPPPPPRRSNSIPANYLALFQQVGQQYGVPWVDPGRHRQGGEQRRPVQPARGALRAERVRRGRPDADRHRRGVREHLGGHPGPPGQRAGQRRGHRRRRRRRRQRVRPGGRHRRRGQVPARARRADQPQRGHLRLQPPHSPMCRQVLHWAGVYAAAASRSTAPRTGARRPPDQRADRQVPNQAVAAAIAYARQQLGKPYLWGGTGPDAFDCSGLVMMAYRAAGHRHPAHLAVAVAVGAAGPGQPGGTRRPGVLRRARTARPPRPATSAWSSARTR